MDHEYRSHPAVTAGFHCATARNPADNPLQSRKAAVAETAVSGTQVKLSEAQARLMQPGTQDIDMGRVEAIKQAIRNGELKMDAGKIADALLQDAQSDVQWIARRD